MPAGAPRRVIARRKWLTRRIRVAMAARFLRVSRILRVNPAGRAAAGAAGTGVTGRAGTAVTPAGSQSRIIASMTRRRDLLAFSYSGPFPFPRDPLRDHVVALSAGQEFLLM